MTQCLFFSDSRFVSPKASWRCHFWWKCNGIFYLGVTISREGVTFLWNLSLNKKNTCIKKKRIWYFFLAWCGCMRGSRTRTTTQWQCSPKWRPAPVISFLYRKHKRIWNDAPTVILKVRLLLNKTILIILKSHNWSCWPNKISHYDGISFLRTCWTLQIFRNLFRYNPPVISSAEMMGWKFGLHCTVSTNKFLWCRTCFLIIWSIFWFKKQLFVCLKVGQNRNVFQN